jgi:hypothetical protein
MMDGVPGLAEDSVPDFVESILWGFNAIQY